jgi:Flp pilus assembly pilin Flp
MIIERISMKKMLCYYADEEGQGMVEYSLIIALVAVTIVGVLILFGDEVKVMYENSLLKMTSLL